MFFKNGLVLKISNIVLFTTDLILKSIIFCYILSHVDYLIFLTSLFWFHWRWDTVLNFLISWANSKFLAQCESPPPTMYGPPHSQFHIRKKFAVLMPSSSALKVSSWQFTDKQILRRRRNKKKAMKISAGFHIVHNT